MAYLEKRSDSGIYRVIFTDNDRKERSLSTGVRSKREAQRIFRESKVSEVIELSRAGKLVSQAVTVLVSGKKLTVPQAIQPYEKWLQETGRSFFTIERHLVQLNAWIRNMNLVTTQLTTLREGHINPWINAPGMNKASSRQMKLAVLKVFFKFCLGKGWVFCDPTLLVKVDRRSLLHSQKERTIKIPFSDQEFETLFNVTAPFGEQQDAWWHFAIGIARFTGLRLGDVCCLEWDCLDTPGYMAVWTRKKEKRVRLPITVKSAEEWMALNGIPMTGEIAVEFERAEQVLTEVFASVQKDSELFLWPHIRFQYLDTSETKSLKSGFRTICRRCNITMKTFHCFRVTYIQKMNALGIPIRHIAGSVGHSRIETTQGYIGNSEE